MPPLRAAEIDRDFATDGVPSSGVHQVRKSDRRAWGTWVEQVIGAFTSNGGLIYSSKALLDADLAKEPNRMAWVLGDAVTANNGVYQKAGATGTGSWTRISDLPFSFIVASDEGAGTADAIVATSPIPISSSALVLLNIAEANTGSPVTVSFNGDAPLTVKSNTGNDIVPGGLQTGMLVAGRVSGSTFRIVTDQVSSAIIAAAEAAATIATNKAAEAAESAAALSLPPITANRMMVDNADGTARESKTFAQVNDLLEKAPWAFDNNTLYKSRSNKDRWLDSYRLAEELNFTGGVTGTNAAIITTLVARAVAAGRREIILPAGDINLETHASIVNALGDTPIRIVGQGPYSTRLVMTSVSQKAMQIGNPTGGATRTKHVNIEGLQLAMSVAPDNNARGFYCRNCSDVTFKDVIAQNVKNGWSFGEGATQTNDAVYVALENCGGQSIGASERAMIILGSGGIIKIKGGAYRWNASGGHDFIVHDNPTWNWDGFYLRDQFFEHFRKYLVSTGAGIVNGEWTCDQVDRADIAFQLESPSGGGNRDWDFHNTKILGFPGTGGGLGFVISGVAESIKVQNNTAIDLTDAFLYAATGNVFVNGNIINNCANLGVSAPLGGALIRLGQGRSRTVNNWGYRPSGAPGVAYRYGIQWDGGSFPERSAEVNTFYNFGAAVTLGTM